MPPKCQGCCGFQPDIVHNGLCAGKGNIVSGIGEGDIRGIAILQLDSQVSFHHTEDRHRMVFSLNVCSTLTQRNKVNDRITLSQYHMHIKGRKLPYYFLYNAPLFCPETIKQ